MKVRKFIDVSLGHLAQHPIMKGAVPTITSVGLSFIESLEVWLRIGGLSIGIVIGLLTIYVKGKEAIRIHRGK